MGYQDAFDANPPDGTQQGTGGQRPPWDHVDYGRYRSGAYGNDAYTSGGYGGGAYGGGGYGGGTHGGGSYGDRGPGNRGYGNRAPNTAPNRAPNSAPSTGGFQARTDDFDAFGGVNPRRTGPINVGRANSSDFTAVDEFTAIDGRLYNVAGPAEATRPPADPGRHAGRGQDLGRRGRGLLAGGVSGFLAAATALGVANLTAAFVRPQASPIIAVGGAFIDRTPPALKNFAVEKFGENDKNMLLLGMYVTIALIAIGIGMIAWRRLWVGIAGIGVFGLFGAFIAYTRPESHSTDVIPSLIGGVVGLVALVWLTQWTTRHAPYSPPPSPLPSRKAAYRPGWSA